MIELKCKECGGPLEAEEDEVVVAESVTVVLSGHTLVCPHCGMRYLAGDTLGLGNSKYNIVIGNVTGSAVAIGDNATVIQSFW